MDQIAGFFSRHHFRVLALVLLSIFTLVGLSGCLFDDDKELSPYEMKRAADYGPVPFLAWVDISSAEDSLDNRTLDTIKFDIILGVDRSDLKVFLNDIPVKYTSIEEMHYENEKTKSKMAGKDFSADLFFTLNDQILWQKELSIPLSQLYSVSYKDTTLYSDDGVPFDGGVFHSRAKPIESLSQNTWFGRTKQFLGGGATPSESPAGVLPDSTFFVFSKSDNLNAAVAWINDEIWDSTRVQYGEIIQYDVYTSRKKYVNLDRWD